MFWAAHMLGWMAKRKNGWPARQITEAAKPLRVVSHLHIVVFVIAPKQTGRGIDDDKIYLAVVFDLSADARQVLVEGVNLLDHEKIPRVDFDVALCCHSN